MENKSKIVPFAAVNGIIINKNREVLLTRRSAQIREPGKWCLPGGHVDGGEDWTTAIRREMNEEVGIEVVSETLMGIYSDPQLCVTENNIPGRDFRGQFLVVCFLINEFKGEITPNFEVDKWGYYSMENLPDPLLRSHPVRIEDGLNFKDAVFVR